MTLNRQRIRWPSSRQFLMLVYAGLFVGLAPTSFAFAATFRVRAVIDLCPEYRYGGVTYSVGYRVGDAATELSPTIVSQDINSTTNKLTVLLDLPDNYAATPLRVFARCANRFGSGEPSAPASISYCSRLALTDNDSDSLRDSAEDSNCDKSYDPGDYSDWRNVDSDGDGILDNVEALTGFSPATAAQSPKPFVIKSGPADFDGDGMSNPVVFRPTQGIWYIKDFGAPNNPLAVSYGLPNFGDIPFTYNAPGAYTNVGVIRSEAGNNYAKVWYFHAPGFLKSDNTRIEALTFGGYSDIPIPGPWETAGRTNPATARLTDSGWQFLVYRFDGTVTSTLFGNIGDLLKPADFDGDGIWDFAVFRPSDNKVYFKRSSDSSVTAVNAGSGSYHYLVSGDATGDGRSEVEFWEPISGMFHLTSSDSGFTSTTQTQLGLYAVHVPLSYFRQGARDLLTVVDHNAATRYYRPNNDAASAIQAVQWGLPGDFQG